MNRLKPTILTLTSLFLLTSIAAPLLCTACTKDKLSPKRATISTLVLSTKAKEGCVTAVCEYRGFISLDSSLSGAKQHLYEGIVIRSDQAHEAFIARIPKRQIYGKLPSDNPLLKRPPVDYSRYIMVIAVSADMRVRPRIDAVMRTASGLTVKVVLPDIGSMIRAPRYSAIGSYLAVVVPKVAGTVGFTFTAGPKRPPPHVRSSAANPRWTGSSQRKQMGSDTRTLHMPLGDWMQADPWWDKIGGRCTMKMRV